MTHDELNAWAIADGSITHEQLETQERFRDLCARQMAEYQIKLMREVMERVGRKDDGFGLAGSKRPWSLLPWDAVGLVVDVLNYGAARYGKWNWLKVEHADDRYFDAAIRHLHAWRVGQQNDEESGLPHLAHAACCVIFLLARPPSKPVSTP
jgi:hypothetical protein